MLLLILIDRDIKSSRLQENRLTESVDYFKISQKQKFVVFLKKNIKKRNEIPVFASIILMNIGGINVFSFFTV